MIPGLSENGVLVILMQVPISERFSCTNTY